MTKYACSESKLTALGDAIRDKAGTTGKMTLDEMATAVEGISTGYELAEGLTYYTAGESVPAGDENTPGCGSQKIVAAITPNVVTVGNHAFYSCRALTSIELPNATSIGNHAFGQCINLTSIELPNATSIGGSAFYWCASLKTLVIRQSDSVCELSASAFADCSALAGIYVPDALVSRYKTATNWKSYASKIKPLSEYEG